MADTLLRLEAPSITPARSRVPRVALATAVVVAVALVVRLIRISASYNIFIDETTYTDIARSVAAGHGVDLHGEPFVLHPPLGFLLLGLALRGLGLQSGEIAPLIIDLRHVTAVFGAVVVGLLYLLIRRTGRAWLAAAVAAVLALDPFQISFDDRVMLEPLAQTFAAGTFLVLAVAATRPAPRWWSGPVLAGLLGAATFLTKETFGLVVAAALAVLVLMPKGLTRRQAGLALGTTLAGYALGNALVVARVGLDVWWSARSSGLARLLGTHQITGFNAPEAKTSLLDAVVANLTQFGPSYLLLACGGLTGLALLAPDLWRLLRRRPSALDSDSTALQQVSHVVAAWAVAACCYVAYAVVFGSLEEQMFYIALAPTAATLVLGAATGLARIRERGTTRRHTLLTRAALAGLAVVLVAQVAVWTYIRTTTDDVYQNFLAWLPEHVAADSRLAVTEETAQFLVTGMQLGEQNTLAALRADHVDYVLVVPSLADQGYGVASGEFIDEVREHGTLVYTRHGRTTGDLQPLELYDVRSYTGGSS